MEQKIFNTIKSNFAKFSKADLLEMFPGQEDIITYLEKTNWIRELDGTYRINLIKDFIKENPDACIGDVDVVFAE